MANPHITIRSDLDTVSVAEYVAGHLAEYMLTMLVSTPLAGHFSNCPVVLDEVLLDTIFVLV